MSTFKSNFTDISDNRMNQLHKNVTHITQGGTIKGQKGNKLNQKGK